MFKENEVVVNEENEISNEFIEAIDISLDLIFLMSDLILLEGSNSVYKDLLELKDKYIKKSDTIVEVEENE